MAEKGKAYSIEIKIRTKNCTCSDIYDFQATAGENYTQSNLESLKTKKLTTSNFFSSE